MNDTTTPAPAPLAVLPTTGCTCGRAVEAAFLDKARREGRKSMVCRDCKARWAVPAEAINVPTSRPEPGDVFGSPEGVDLGGAAPVDVADVALPPPPSALPEGVAALAQDATSGATGLVGAAVDAARAAVAAGGAILGYLVAFAWPERHSIARDLVEDEAERAFGPEAKRLVPRHSRGGALLIAVRRIARDLAKSEGILDPLAVELEDKDGDMLAVSIARRKVDPTTKTAVIDVGAKGAIQVVTYDRDGQGPLPSSRLSFAGPLWHDEIRQAFDDKIGKVDTAALRVLVYRLLADHAKSLDAEVARFVPPQKHAELDQVARFVKALGGSFKAWPIANTPEGRAESRESAYDSMVKKLDEAEKDLAGLVDPEKGSKTRVSTLEGRIADLDELRGLAMAHRLVLEADLPTIEARLAALGERLAEAAAKGA